MNYFHLWIRLPRNLKILQIIWYLVKKSPYIQTELTETKNRKRSTGYSHLVYKNTNLNCNYIQQNR